MTIPLTGAGSFFVRAGHIIGPCQDLQAIMGGAATTNITSGIQYPARFTTINTDATNGTGIPITMSQPSNNPNQNLASFQQQTALFQWASTLVKAQLNAMYNLDQSLPEMNSVPGGTAVVKYLINQMFGSGGFASPTATLQSSTVTIGAQTNGIPTPTGNPILFLTGVNPQGQALQLIFAEKITFTTIRDSQNGTAPGNEVIGYAGQAGATWPNYLYPAGSGCQGSLSCVDGSKSLGATGNLLNNSDFTAYNGSNANYPDNWVIVVGAAGTGFLNGTSAHSYSPTVNGVVGGSLAWVGNSSTLLKIKQAFATTPSTTNGAGGTSQVLTPDTQYGFNFWGIIPAGIPAAGVLRVSLQDGAGNILNDDTGSPQSVAFNLNTLSVGNAFFNFNGSLRTPANLTTQTTPFFLCMDMTTALSTGSILYTSREALATLTPLYPNGPQAAFFSGQTRTINGNTPDTWTIAITNTRGKLQDWMDRLFGLRANNLQFPYSGSPSVADSLIV